VTLGGGCMATPRGAGAPSLLQLLLSFPAPTHPWVPALLTSIRSAASHACLPACPQPGNINWSRERNRLGQEHRDTAYYGTDPSLGLSYSGG
jgi:hypothetical protein